MRNRVIHLINPKTDSLTTRPLYLKRRFTRPRGVDRRSSRHSSRSL